MIDPERSDIGGVRVLRNAHLVLPDRMLLGDLAIRGNAIQALAAPGSLHGDEIYDLDGRVLLPGLIDTHTHGGWGIDFYKADLAETARAAALYARSGVTRLLITLHPGPRDELCDRLASVARACDTSSAFLGIHLEGPFLSKDRRGALPEAGILPWDERLMHDLHVAADGKLRVMTFAPEALPAGEIQRIQSTGVILSVGHTNATTDETLLALRAGVQRATHLCNAMPLMHHRNPGPVLAVLLDARARTEVVVDGEHIDDRFLLLLLGVKGRELVLAVSDSMPLAGSELASCDFCGVRVERRGQRAVLADGTLAGSVQPLYAALRRVEGTLDLTLERIALLGATVPAADLRLPNAGRIATGAVADLVVTGAHGEVLATLRGGERADQPGGAFLPESIRRLQ